MIVRFLSCRERFRLKYVLGLEPPDRWNKNIGYGNMWHTCEEAHAGNDVWQTRLIEHLNAMLAQYPLQYEEITKWFNVCCVQFPEYVKYWSEHLDVKNRTPLMQEQVFDAPYTLPSGRTVRLRGKFDSVDLIDGGIYLQENKTKGDIDKAQVERQLKFDLQTMMYLVALRSNTVRNELMKLGVKANDGWEPSGVRYNVVRRPLSGGIGSIKPHSAKSTKTKFTPAETAEEFYERLRRDYIADDPAHWFFRVRVEISEMDVQVFRNTCLDHILEQLCDWYDWTTDNDAFDWQEHPDRRISASGLHYRTPFGVWSALEEGGSTEYDAYLATGSEAGLRRVETLFTELQ